MSLHRYNSDLRMKIIRVQDVLSRSYVGLMNCIIFMILSSLLGVRVLEIIASLSIVSAVLSIAICHWRIYVLSRRLQ